MASTASLDHLSEYQALREAVVDDFDAEEIVAAFVGRLDPSLAASSYLCPSHEVTSLRETLYSRDA